MTHIDTGPTPKGKRRVRVPFNPKVRNVTEREYTALEAAGYVKQDLPPKPAPEPASAQDAAATQPPTAPATRRRTTTSKEG